MKQGRLTEKPQGWSLTEQDVLNYEKGNTS